MGELTHRARIGTTFKNAPVGIDNRKLNKLRVGVKKGLQAPAGKPRSDSRDRRQAHRDVREAFLGANRDVFTGNVQGLKFISPRLVRDNAPDKNG